MIIQQSSVYIIQITGSQYNIHNCSHLKKGILKTKTHSSIFLR